MRIYILKSFQTEVTVEALHLNDCVDTYSMRVRFDGCTYNGDISAYVFANPFAAYPRQ